MRARTTLFIVFLAGVLVFATFSPAVAAQASSEQQRGYQQSQQNSPGNNSNFSDDLSNTMNPQQGGTKPPDQAVTPGAAPSPAPQSDVQRGVGNTPTRVARGHVAWGWLLLGGVLGFVIGVVVATPRRPAATVEDIRRDRAA